MPINFDKNKTEGAKQLCSESCELINGGKIGKGMVCNGNCGRDSVWLYNKKIWQKQKAEPQNRRAKAPKTVAGMAAPAKEALPAAAAVVQGLAPVVVVRRAAMEADKRSLVLHQKRGCDG